MPKKARAAGAEAGLLPIGTRLSVRLPREELPPEVAKALAAELEEAEEPEWEGDAGAQGPGAQWCTGTVVRARARPKAGASGAEGGLRHLLRLGSGAELWVEVERWPFLLHPPAREEAEAGPFDEEDDAAGSGAGGVEALRAQLAAQLPAPGAADAPAAPSEAGGGTKSQEKAPDLGAPHQQQAWNKEMTAAGSAAALAALIEANVRRFDALNVAAALHRLSRRSPFAEAEAEAAWSAVRHCVARAAGDGLMGYSVQGVSNICWAIARLGVKVSLPSSGEPEDAEAQPEGPKEDGQALAATPQRSADPALAGHAAAVFRSAMSRLCEDVGWAAREDWEEVAAWNPNWAGGGLWGGWKPQEVANLSWAIMRAAGARAGSGVAGQLLSLVAQGVTLSSWKGFSPQELASTLSALLTAGRAPPFLMQRALSKVRRHRSMFKPQELCLVLSAALRTLPTKSIRPVLCAAVDDAVSAELQGYKSIDLANLIGLLGRLHYRSLKANRKVAKGKSIVKTCMPFISAVIASAGEKEEQWQPPELAALVFGLSRLALADGELLAGVCRRWRAWLASADEATPPPPSAATARTLSTLALGLARLGHGDAALGAAACARLREALKAGDQSCSPHYVVGALWGFSCALALGDGAAEGGRAAEEPDETAAKAAPQLAAGLSSLLRTLVVQSRKRGLDLSSPAHMAQLHAVHLALRAFAVAGGSGADAGEEDEAAAARWQPPEASAEAWRAAFAQQRAPRLAERSQLRAEVCSHLEESVLPELYPQGCGVEGEAAAEGVYVDILLQPQGRKLAPVCLEFTHPRDSIRTFPDMELELDGDCRFRSWLLRRLLKAVPISVPVQDWRACAGDAEAKRALLLEALRPASMKKLRRQDDAEADAVERPRKRPRKTKGAKGTDEG